MNVHTFDDTQHLHVGYYEGGKDLEGIFFKIVGEPTWCLFFDHDFYGLKVSGTYSWDSSFGLLVDTISTKHEELTYERGCLLFQQFLEREKFI
ncbi:DUF3986 family protein [Alkalicoccobacillus murimartini]|uniref:DUF3986 family protein n=1 Tax=Alkalicoccobacillus murimartini TaxID=171685 RepID=A0ABT9YHU8_9BACI|nr:DUF3986 family protein [Alkalicoccobacillus murimartini]MDQ0207443.1 hypothetical protein [Alkalicoccobacillus murimartini]